MTKEKKDFLRECVDDKDALEDPTTPRAEVSRTYDPDDPSSPLAVVISLDPDPGDDDE